MISVLRIVMTKVMEHSDDKLVEYFDDNGMEHCDESGMGHCDEKEWSHFLTGFKEHSEDKCQESL